jgi:hypothetical protein
MKVALATLPLIPDMFAHSYAPSATTPAITILNCSTGKNSIAQMAKGASMSAVIILCFNINPDLDLQGLPALQFVQSVFVSDKNQKQLLETCFH